MATRPTRSKLGASLAQRATYGKWKDLVSQYTDSIKADPDNYVNYEKRSAAYIKIGQPEKALADANRCIALKEGDHKGYLRKGAAYHMMKEYDQAIAAYNEGLKHSPDEEVLKKGIAAARRARVETYTARKSTMTRRASVATSLQAKKARNVSAFVTEARKELELTIAAAQAQLDLINDLASMPDAEKMDLLFALIDRDCNGTIDARELAGAMRKRNQDLSFAESLDRAMNAVATFDVDGDAKLDHDEFEVFVKVMLGELGTTFNEFSEFLVLQLMLVESQNTIEEEIVGELAKSQIDQEVKNRQELLDLLMNPRLADLFLLFDKDGSRELDFKEVAIGLYQVTQNMEEATQATVKILLMLDKEDKRTLDYTSFGRLIMTIMQASGGDITFEDLADGMAAALVMNDTITEDALVELVMADIVYETAKDIEKEVKEAAEVVDALSYGRLQKLFELMDESKDGFISFSELTKGLRKFQDAIGSFESPELTALALLGFDTSGEYKLGPVEFARAMVQYAKAYEVELHELIDFMCLTTIFGDDQTQEYRQAYGKSLAGEDLEVEAVYLEFYVDEDDLN